MSRQDILMSMLSRGQRMVLASLDNTGQKDARKKQNKHYEQTKRKRTMEWLNSLPADTHYNNELPSFSGDTTAVKAKASKRSKSDIDATIEGNLPTNPINASMIKAEGSWNAGFSEFTIDRLAVDDDAAAMVIERQSQLLSTAMASRCERSTTKHKLPDDVLPDDVAALITELQSQAVSSAVVSHSETDTTHNELPDCMDAFVSALHSQPVTATAAYPSTETAANKMDCHMPFNEQLDVTSVEINLITDVIAAASEGSSSNVIELPSQLLSTAMASHFERGTTKHELPDDVLPDDVVALIIELQSQAVSSAAVSHCETGTTHNELPDCMDAFMSALQSQPVTTAAAAYPGTETAANKMDCHILFNEQLDVTSVESNLITDVIAAASEGSSSNVRLLSSDINVFEPQSINAMADMYVSQEDNMLMAPSFEETTSTMSDTLLQLTDHMNTDMQATPGWLSNVVNFLYISKLLIGFCNILCTGTKNFMLKSLSVNKMGFEHFP